ncbi:MAG: hypothetical protein D6780_03555, partial [Candidatus Dadabacteria bacterium]
MEEELCQKIFLAYPQAVNLLEDYKGRSLYHYCQEISEQERGKVKLSPYFKEAIKNTVGEDEFQKLTAYFSKSSICNTSDHHQILGFAEFINTNLLNGLIATMQQAPCTVTFSFSSIPLNSSSFSRGFFYNQKRFSLFPDKMKRCVVYTAPCFKREKIAGFPEEIQEVFNSVENLFNLPSFSQQIRAVNKYLWDNLRETAPFLPPLIYLPIEEVVKEIII